MGNTPEIAMLRNKEKREKKRGGGRKGIAPGTGNQPKAITPLNQISTLKYSTGRKKSG